MGAASVAAFVTLSRRDRRVRWWFLALATQLYDVVMF
jgi:hypothetical protein